MNKTTTTAVALLIAMAGASAMAADKVPMPQTRGMQGMDPKAHDPANKPTVTCTPKAGTEGMAHSAKDHPMADTKGMKGMDPAQHMQNCESSDKPAPVELGPHQHKTPGQS